jgi:hypothetical protein
MAGVRANEVEVLLRLENQMQPEIEKAKGMIASMGGAFGTALKAASVGFVAATAAAGGYAIQSAMVALRADEMNVALGALAKANNLNVGSLNAYVTAIRHQGIEMGVSQNLVAEFVRGHLDLAKATDLARVAQDSAVISGQNSTETLAQLVDGIRTQQVEVLRSAGITINAEAAYEKYAKAHGTVASALDATTKQQIILDEVLREGAKVQGAYAAAMETPSKQLRSIPRLLNDISLNVGQAFLPAIGGIIHNGYEMAKALAAATEPGKPLATVLDSIGKAASALLGPLSSLTKHAEHFLEKLTPEKVASFTGALEKLAPLLATAGGGMLALGTGALRSLPLIGGFIPVLNPILAALAGLVALSPELRTTLGQVAEAFGRVAAQVGPRLAEMLNKVLMSFGKILEAISPLIPKLADLAGKFLIFQITVVAALIDKALPAVDAFARALGHFIDKVAIPALDRLNKVDLTGTLVAGMGTLETLARRLATEVWPALQRAGKDLGESMGSLARAWGDVNVQAGLSAKPINETRKAMQDADFSVGQFLKENAAQLLAYLTVELPFAINLAAAGIRIMTGHIEVLVATLGGGAKVMGDILRGDFKAAWADSQATVAGAVQGMKDEYGGWSSFAKLTSALMRGDVTAEHQKMADDILAILASFGTGARILEHDRVQGTINENVRMHKELVGGSIIPDMVNQALAWFSAFASGAVGIMAGMAGGVVGQAWTMAGGVVGAFAGLPGQIAGALGGLWSVGFDAIWNLVRGMQSVHIPTPHFSVGWEQLGPISVPDIGFAGWWGKGGMFAALGPTLAGFGERGPELVTVSPLGSLGASAAAASAPVLRGNASRPLTINLSIDGYEFASIVARYPDLLGSAIHERLLLRSGNRGMV